MDIWNLCTVSFIIFMYLFITDYMLLYLKVFSKISILFLNRLIVLILIRKSITSLRKHLQKVTERLPLYHDDDSSSLAPSATSPSITGAKPAAGDPAANAMVGPPQLNNVPPKSPPPPTSPQPKASAPPPPLLLPPEPKALVPLPPLPSPPKQQQPPQVEPEVVL